MEKNTDFKTKPVPRSSYSLISLASQTTQIISDELVGYDIDKRACSSVIPKTRPIIHSRRSPFMKQRLMSTNKNFSQSISTDLLYPEDIYQKNFCVETMLYEHKHQLVSAKIYINDSKQISTSSLWYSGFIEILNDRLYFTKVNKNISKAEKFPTTNISLSITPQLMLTPLQKYYICKYGTKIGFEINIRKFLAQTSGIDDIIDGEKGPLVRIAFNHYNISLNFHKYLLSRIYFSKCSYHYMLYGLSTLDKVNHPPENHIILFEVNAEIFLSIDYNNNIKSNRGFLSVYCCFWADTFYRKKIYGQLDTIGFNELNLQLIKYHRNYRKTSYNDAEDNQIHLILPKQSNKICLIKYSYYNNTIPKIAVYGHYTINNRRKLQISVDFHLKPTHTMFKDIKQLVFSIYLPTTLCNLFLVKNGYMTSFLKTKECKKFISNNSGTSKLFVSKGEAFYDDISSSIKWIIDFVDIFGKNDTITAFISLFRSNNVCKSSSAHELLNEHLECVINAPFDIILHEKYEYNIQLDYIFKSNTNVKEINNIITSTNSSLSISNTNIYYLDDHKKVHLSNIHTKYSQSITAYYDVQYHYNDE